MIGYFLEKKHSNLWAISMFVLGNAWANGWYWQSFVAMLIAAVLVSLGEVLYEEGTR